MDKQVFELEIQTGERSGTRFVVPTTGLRLGRSSECDLQIEDRAVSRLHCTLNPSANSVEVRDEASRWGTFVNGSQIQSHHMCVGDRLRVGEHELLLLEVGSPTLSWKHDEDETIHQSFHLYADPSSNAKKDLKTATEPPTDHSSWGSTLVGKPFGKFVIGKKLAVANTGIVFSAWDDVSSQKVALKLYWPSAFANDAQLSRFIAAIEIAAEINHPNLVRVVRAGCTQGIFFLASEWIDGESSDQFVRRVGVGSMLDWRQVLPIVTAAVDGLVELAANGLRHGAIHPANLLITAASPPIAKLNDYYNCVRVVHSNSPQLEFGDAESKNLCQPPEYFTRDGHLDHRSDIFSLGATVYWMLTGQFPSLPPFESPPPLPSKYQLSVSPLLESEVMRMLEKRPQDRHGDAAEVAQALRKITKYSDYV